MQCTLIQYTWVSNKALFLLLQRTFSTTTDTCMLQVALQLTLSDTTGKYKAMFLILKTVRGTSSFMKLGTKYRIFFQKILIPISPKFQAIFYFHLRQSSLLEIAKNWARHARRCQLKTPWCGAYWFNDIRQNDISSNVIGLNQFLTSNCAKTDQSIHR